MAEEEVGSGGRLRRNGQVGCGEKEQVQGEQAAMGSPIGTWPRKRPALEDTYAPNKGGGREHPGGGGGAVRGELRGAGGSRSRVLH